MISDEEIRSLPDDPDLAFAEFESIVRQSMARDRQEEGSDVERTYVSYILAFIHENDVKIDLDNEVPGFDKEFWPYFHKLIRQIDYHKTRMRLRALKGAISNISSIITLTQDYRDQIHEQISSIRKIINAVELPSARREVLFKRLNALAAEVDRDRTRLESLTSIWLETTQAIGEGFENLEPAIKKIERLAKIFSRAKADNENGLISAPEERKMITGPEYKQEEEKLDDDIPF